MNNRQYAYQRDKKALEYIEMLQALTTTQIQELVYKNERKAQQRMLKLSSRVNRTRPCIDWPYVYYYDKPAQLEHIILRNWVYIYLSKRYRVTDWQNGKDFGVLKCDAICRIRSVMEDHWAFVEIERDSRNEFNKLDLYNKLYEQQGFVNSPLMKQLGNPPKFPKIIIYAANPKVVKYNHFGLNVQFIFPDDIRSLDRREFVR
jgi:hypothetical protein